MTPIDLGIGEPLARQVGWALVHFVWQGAAVAALLRLALEALRRRAANARYVAACVAMALLAAAPVATFVLLPSAGGVADPSPSAAPAAIGRLPAGEHAVAGRDDNVGGGRQVAHVPDRARRTSVAAPPVEPTQGGKSPVAPATADAPAAWPERLRTRVEPALPWCVAAWLAGVIVLSAWHLAAWGKVQRLRATGTRPAGDALQAAARRLAGHLGIRRPVRLLASVRATAPMVIGWLRPVVLVPVSAATGLAPEQIEAILAHELAHIRRHDYLVNLLQSVVETLLFYHPAVWWVSRRIRIEREHCCDDVAVEACGDRSGYAGALATLAENMVAPRAAVAAGGGCLLGRIRRLLIPRAGHAGAFRTHAASAVLVAGLLVLACCWAIVAAGSNAPRQAPGELDKRIPELVRQLGADAEAVRSKAYEELMKLAMGDNGTSLVPALESAIQARNDRKVHRFMTVLTQVGYSHPQVVPHLIARIDPKEPLQAGKLLDVVQNIVQPRGSRISYYLKAREGDLSAQEIARARAYWLKRHQEKHPAKPGSPGSRERAVFPTSAATQPAEVDLGLDRLKIEANPPDKLPGGLYAVGPYVLRRGQAPDAHGLYVLRTENKIGDGYQQLVGRLPVNLYGLGMRGGAILEVAAFKRVGNRVLATLRYAAPLKGAKLPAFSVYLRAWLPKLPPGKYEARIEFEGHVRAGGGKLVAAPKGGWPKIPAMTCTFQVSGGAPATRPATMPAEALEARIAGLVAQLGSDKHAERAAAQKALVQVGRPAVRALQAACGDKDAERAVRAQAALLQIKERFTLKKEAWRNRWEGISLSLRVSAPAGEPGSMSLDVDPQGKAIARLWEPRPKALVRYESVLSREELDTLATRLGRQRPWELNLLPKWRFAAGGMISLRIAVGERFVDIEQPWPPPGGLPPTRQNAQLLSGLMAIRTAATHLVEVVRRDAAIRAQGGAAGGRAAAKEPPPAKAGQRTALRKVLDLLDLPWQTRLTAEELDAAAASIRANADQAVDAIRKAYDATNNNSFRHRAVRIFERLGTAKARAALLDIALGRTADKLPSSHGWAARAYLRTIPEPADARQLLASDEPGVLNAALLALKSQPVDAALLKRIAQIIQRKAKHPSGWLAIHLAAADVIAADPRPVLLKVRVEVVLAVLSGVAGMPQKHEIARRSSLTYAEMAYGRLLGILREMPAEAGPLLKRALAARGGAERAILVIALASRGDATVRKDILAILADGKAGLRRAWAARALGVIGTAEDLPLLKRLARTDPLERDSASDVGPAGARPKIYPVRWAAKDAIEAIERKAPAAQPAKGPSTTPAEAPWSKAVNGLEARVTLKRTEVINGTPIISTSLELRNVSGRGEPMKLAWNSDRLKPRVLDGDGHELRTAHGPYDGPAFGSRSLLIPRGGTVSLNISCRGLGIGADKAGLIDLGPSHCWVFETREDRYDFQAVLEIPKPKEDRDETGWNWHGRIEIPPARVPLKTQPPDPAKVGPRIEQLGRKMMDRPGSGASEAAARALSLFDDVRVIPWYLKAMDTDSYGLKFAAIGRLCRFRGDEALKGLKKGMAQTNTNLRLAAAQGLARSPHPNARKLLLSMRNDPYYGVRITILHTFGRKDTAESRKLLEEMTRDSNKLVRDEARRYLDLLRAPAAARAAELVVGKAPAGPPADNEATAGIRTVADAFESLKAELVGMRGKYPRLAGAGKAKVDERGLLYVHNCRPLAKGGYQNTGPNAIAVGIEVMRLPKPRKPADNFPGQPLPYKWPALGFVGRTILHLGPGSAPDLSPKLKEVLARHLAMIDRLDRRAAARGRAPVAAEAELTALGDALRKAVGGDWKIRQEEEGIGPVLAGLDNSVMVFPFPFDKAGQQRFHRFQALYAEPFCVYGSNGHCTVASGPGGVREDVLAVLGLSRAALAKGAGKVHAAHPDGGKAMWHALAARVHPGMSARQMKVLLPPARLRPGKGPQEVATLDGARFAITYALDGAWGVQASGIAQGKSQDQWVLDAAPRVRPRKDLPMVTTRPATQPAAVVAETGKTVWGKPIALKAGLWHTREGTGRRTKVFEAATLHLERRRTWPNVNLKYRYQAFPKAVYRGEVALLDRDGRSLGEFRIGWLSGVLPEDASGWVRSGHMGGAKWNVAAAVAYRLTMSIQPIPASEPEGKLERTPWSKAGNGLQCRLLVDRTGGLDEQVYLEIRNTSDNPLKIPVYLNAAPVVSLKFEGYPEQHSLPTVHDLSTKLGCLQPGQTYRHELNGKNGGYVFAYGRKTGKGYEEFDPANKAYKMRAVLEVDRKDPFPTRRDLRARPWTGRVATPWVEIRLAARPQGKHWPPEAATPSATRPGSAATKPAAMSATDTAKDPAKGQAGKLEYYTRPSSIGIVARRVFTDAAGRHAKVIYYRSRDGSRDGPRKESDLVPQSIRTYRYDHRGRCIREEELDPAMKLRRVRITDYHPDGTRRSISTLDPAGRLTYLIRYRGNASVSHLYFDDQQRLAGIRGEVPADFKLVHGWGKPVGDLSCGLAPQRQAAPLRDQTFCVTIRNDGKANATVQTAIQYQTVRLELRDESGALVPQDERYVRRRRGELLRMNRGANLSRQTIRPGLAALYGVYRLDEWYRALRPGRYTLTVWHRLAEDFPLRSNPAQIVVTEEQGAGDPFGHYLRLYAQYKARILAAALSGDKEKVAAGTDEFSAAIGRRLLYVRVLRMGPGGKAELLIAKALGDRRVILPRIHYRPSTQPHVTVTKRGGREHLVLVETNRQAGGKYADGIRITMALEPVPPASRPPVRKAAATAEEGAAAAAARPRTGAPLDKETLLLLGRLQRNPWAGWSTGTEVVRQFLDDKRRGQNVQTYVQPDITYKVLEKDRRLIRTQQVNGKPMRQDFRIRDQTGIPRPHLTGQGAAVELAVDGANVRCLLYESRIGRIGAGFGGAVVTKQWVPASHSTVLLRRESGENWWAITSLRARKRIGQREVLCIETRRRLAIVGGHVVTTRYLHPDVPGHLVEEIKEFYREVKGRPQPVLWMVTHERTSAVRAAAPTTTAPAKAGPLRTRTERRPASLMIEMDVRQPGDAPVILTARLTNTSREDIRDDFESPLSFRAFLTGPGGESRRVAFTNGAQIEGTFGRAPVLKPGASVATPLRVTNYAAADWRRVLFSEQVHLRPGKYRLRLGRLLPGPNPTSRLMAEGTADFTVVRDANLAKARMAELHHPANGRERFCKHVLEATLTPELRRQWYADIKDPDPKKAVWKVYTLCSIADPPSDVMPAIVEALKVHVRNPNVGDRDLHGLLNNAARAIGNRRPAGAGPALLALAGGKFHPSDRGLGLLALRHYYRPDMADRIADLLDDKAPAVALQAAGLLAWAGDARGAGVLIAAAKARDPSAAAALAHLPDHPPAAAALRDALASKDKSFVRKLRSLIAREAAGPEQLRPQRALKAAGAIRFEPSRGRSVAYVGGEWLVIYLVADGAVVRLEIPLGAKRVDGSTAVAVAAGKARATLARGKDVWKYFRPGGVVPPPPSPFPYKEESATSGSFTCVDVPARKTWPYHGKTKTTIRGVQLTFPSGRVGVRGPLSLVLSPYPT